MIFRSLIGLINELSLVSSPARRTEVSSTEAASQTETAKRFLIQVTPGIGSIRYNFYDSACKAEWRSSGSIIPCLPGPDSSDTAVLMQSDFTIEEMGIRAPAIFAPMKSLNSIHGEFSAMAIREKDHFRATIKCVNDNPDCNIAFALYLEMQDETFVKLGRWAPNGANNIEEIDVDLTKFAGKFVRFIFLLDSIDYTSETNQDFVWIFPRIER